MHSVKFKFNPETGESLATEYVLTDDIHIDIQDKSLRVGSVAITEASLKQVLGQEKRVEQIFRQTEIDAVTNAETGDLCFDDAKNVFIFDAENKEWLELTQAAAEKVPQADVASEILHDDQPPEQQVEQVITEPENDSLTVALEEEVEELKNKCELLEDMIKDVIGTLIPSKRLVITQKYGIEVEEQP